MGRFSSGGGGFKGVYIPRSRSAPSRPAPRPAKQTPPPAPAKTSNYGGRGMNTDTYSIITQGISFGIMRNVATHMVLDYVKRPPPSNSNEHKIIETSSTSSSTNQKMRSTSTRFDMDSRSAKCYEDVQNQIIGCSYGGSIYEWRSVSSVMEARLAVEKERLASVS